MESEIWINIYLKKITRVKEESKNTLSTMEKYDMVFKIHEKEKQDMFFKIHGKEKQDMVFKIHRKEKQDMDFKTKGWFIKSFKEIF